MRLAESGFEFRSIQGLVAVTLLGFSFIRFSAAGDDPGPAPTASTTVLRKSNQATKRGNGSASVLDGSIYVYNVFLSDSQSQWTEEEKASVRKRLHLAFDFIVRQGRQHDKDIIFVEEYAEDLTLPLPIPVDAHADPRWTEFAIAQSASESPEALVRRIRRQTEVDNVILALHVNKASLSYNLAYYQGVANRYTAERMICFSAYPDGRVTSAATYAHEILHLFGAGDLYFPYDDTPIRKERAARLFPNDVMYRVDYDLNQLDVGAFTAYRVGWRMDLEARLTTFED